MLPLLPEAYAKSPPQFDILMQARGDVFADRLRNDTFFLRKAEIGIKGHVAAYVDFCLEFETTRPADPLRRTYVRLTHVPWLHMKLGLEKAPIGLEELTSTAQIPFVERSAVTDLFAAAEELGVHLESRWPHWLFQLSVTNGERRLLRDNNSQKDVSSRIVWGPCSWLSFGVAILQGWIGMAELERDRYNVEFKLGSNLSGIQSEFYRAQDGNLWSSAYYFAGYRAFRMNRTWPTHLQPVIRYEQIDRSDRNKFEELRLLTLGLSLMLDEHRSKFQINFLKDLHTGTRRDEVRAQYQIEF
ncbi:MAG: porin [bacterium]